MAERTAARSSFPFLPPRTWLALLCLAAVPLFFLDLSQPGFQENEGRYAAVAREMLLTGDWITPHLNGEVFLNKPPLTFWLTALVFRAAGTTEAARLVCGLATLATLLLLYDLGRLLWRPSTGAWAAAVFLTSALTPLEARTLRPDPLVVLFLCLTLWGAVRVSQAGRKSPDILGQAAIWAGAGLGVMAKGLMGVALPALILLPALTLAGGWKEARRYCPWWGPLLLAVLVLPWHIAAGLRTPGFWWDYVVNQHLLFFLD
ncbi:MAG TPA: glycosyltransferase family 39 protein, partial [Armatimonadota bacterium]|nr:glycosyltransferase family 39 protein [Armatimonadota bacterium]